MAYKGNPKKIERILDAVGTVDSVMDIGCNYGFMAKAFLDNNQANHCYGLELDRNTVSTALLKHPQFTFYEGDLVTFKFPEKYDVCIYTAVHHHLFAAHGRMKAMNAWRKILRACNKTIILETGVMDEQGKEWADALKQHYKDDADHLEKLLSSVGKRFESIETLMEIPLRGAMRPVYKIELKNG